MAASFLPLIAALLSPCTAGNMTLLNATLVQDPRSFQVASESVHVQGNSSSANAFLQKRTNNNDTSATPASASSLALASLPEIASNLSLLARSNLEPATVSAAISALALILNAAGLGSGPAGGTTNYRLNLLAVVEVVPGIQVPGIVAPGPGRFSMSSFTQVGNNMNIQKGVVIRAAGGSESISEIDVLAFSINIRSPGPQKAVPQLARDFFATVGDKHIKDKKGGGDPFLIPANGQALVELLVTVNNRIFHLVVMQGRKAAKNTWYIGTRYGRKNPNSIYVYSVTPDKNNRVVRQDREERLVISQTTTDGGRGFKVSLQGF